ncbi:MAG TPA: hypothetical protein VFB75_22470 [Burkholderiales bacterium]|nr:hypothetical protein [Burkholderiales bacterium]
MAKAQSNTVAHLIAQFDEYESGFMPRIIAGMRGRTGFAFDDAGARPTER